MRTLGRNATGLRGWGRAQDVCGHTWLVSKKSTSKWEPELDVACKTCAHSPTPCFVFVQAVGQEPPLLMVRPLHSRFRGNDVSWQDRAYWVRESR